MIKKNFAVGNILKVAFSRGISLASGVATGLLLPKLLSVTDYGFLKIYTLYLVYTALLHFGFVDGVLLKFAGKRYDELDKIRFRTYTLFFVLFQVVIGMAMLGASCFLLNSDYRFILLMLSFNMIIINLTTYYQFISQATQRFGEYSMRNLLVAVFKLALVLALLLLQYVDKMDISYRMYIVCLNIIDGLLLLWYVFTYRGITFGKMMSLLKLRSEIFGIFKMGIVLTVAYQISHLVFALDRQFVSILYPTETYGQYSFAYNIVTLISTMISSMSVVLFPMLKRVTRELTSSYYKKLITAVAVLVGASMVCYYPFEVFVKWFLPEYNESLVYLKVVLPILTFSSCISVVMFTLCKVLDENFRFFINGCVALVIGFVTNTIAYLIWKTPLAISAASLVTMALWFILEARHLKKLVGVGAAREFIYLILLSVSFVAITMLLTEVWMGLVMYFVLFTVVTAVVYRKELVTFFKRRGNDNN